MQTTITSVRRGARGFALILTMVFLLVSLIIFGSIMYWVSSNAKVSMRNNQFNMSENAAEAGVETVLAQMDRDYLYQGLTNAAFYGNSNNANGGTLLPNQTNWPAGYTYSDTNRVINQISVWIGLTATNTQPLNSQYAGLYGFAQNCSVTATATPASASGAGSSWVYSVPATISEAFQLASIPLFQFAIFYNLNLEIAPGQNMVINGPVFCNQSIWEGASDTTFSNTVTAVGTNDTSANDPFALNYSKDGGPTFDDGLPLSGADALTMPIAGATNSNPTNVEAILQLPPSTYALGTTAAYSTNGQVYLANAADLYITNTPSGTNSGNASWMPSGTNTYVYFQDSALKFVTPDYYFLKKPWTNGVIGTFTNYVNPNTTAAAGIDSVSNVQFAGYSFITNAFFYDWREGWIGGGSGFPAKTVQAVQIDVSLFNTWVTNTATNGGNFSGNPYTTTKSLHTGHPIDSMYVYTGVPLTSRTLPAVRVVNGQQLGSSHGFAIATPFPLYVWGDFNSQTTAGSSLNSNTTGNNSWPAGFYADAVTILSDGWTDSAGGATKNPGIAQTTTINAAMLEGIVQSNGTNYSGGVENFMRLLEDWTSGGGQTLWYNGSIVVMFPSVYATNDWRPTGGYYNAPTRHWAFDTNFRQVQGLPPLYPGVKAVIRGQWSVLPNP